MPTIPTSFILTLKQLVADEILADPLFDDVPGIALKEKDTDSELENAINNLDIGFAVIITSLNCEMNQNRGAFFSDISVQVGVCENRLTNATGKSAEVLAERIASILPMFKPANCTGPLVLDKPSIVTIPPQKKEDRDKKLLAVNFTCSGGLQEIPPQIAPVTRVQNEDGEEVLSCATVGAVIFYRTDGKHPNPRYGSGSSLYTAPFELGEATTLKARAWLPGYIASELFTHNRE